MYPALIMHAVVLFAVFLGLKVEIFLSPFSETLWADAVEDSESWDMKILKSVYIWSHDLSISITVNI